MFVQTAGPTRWSLLAAMTIALGAMLVMVFGPVGGAGASPARGITGLTSAQIACLSSHGVTRPITASEKSTALAAAQACGINVGHAGTNLTSAQIACLSSHGVTRPITASEKSTALAAAQAWGIKV